MGECDGTFSRHSGLALGAVFGDGPTRLFMCPQSNIFHFQFAIRAFSLTLWTVFSDVHVQEPLLSVVATERALCWAVILLHVLLHLCLLDNSVTHLTVCVHATTHCHVVGVIYASGQCCKDRRLVYLLQSSGDSWDIF